MILAHVDEAAEEILPVEKSRLSTVENPADSENFPGGISLLFLLEDVGASYHSLKFRHKNENFICLPSKVKVGDKEVDVLKGFTLYITTKLGNPAYTPEV